MARRGGCGPAGSYSVAVCVAALLPFWRAVDAVDVAGSFLEGRLATPIAYANANCALCLSAALPALYLASRREVPVLLRGVFLAVTGVLVELALLTQSRASLIAVPVALVLYFVLVPSRLRSALALGLVAVAVLSVLPRLLDVYEVLLEGADAGAALRDARVAIVRTALVLVVLGVLVGLVDRRLELSSHSRRSPPVRPPGSSRRRWSRPSLSVWWLSPIQSPVRRVRGTASETRSTSPSRERHT